MPPSVLSRRGAVWPSWVERDAESSCCDYAGSEHCVGSPAAVPPMRAPGHWGQGQGVTQHRLIPLIIKHVGAIPEETLHLQTANINRFLLHASASNLWMQP